MGSSGRASELVVQKWQRERWNVQIGNDNTYRTVESAELVMKTSEFLGCHEHDVNSLTWPLQRKVNNS